MLGNISAKTAAIGPASGADVLAIGAFAAQGGDADKVPAVCAAEFVYSVMAQHERQGFGEPPADGSVFENHFDEVGSTGHLHIPIALFNKNCHFVHWRSDIKDYLASRVKIFKSLSDIDAVFVFGIQV